ncbi:hypothetical protein MEX01_53430 [Methylorubrum extorquens]|nr:hypothetical protein MEX01_53430 [Methylorubrum extorquens]
MLLNRNIDNTITMSQGARNPGLGRRLLKVSTVYAGDSRLVAAPIGRSDSRLNAGFQLQR